MSLIPKGDHAAKDGHSPVAQFFVNVRILADSNTQQAVVLFSMLFTLVIWFISAINLLVAIALYLLFLFHHIPSADGGLSGYCRRKINGRVTKIVKGKVDKALRKENALRARQEAEQGQNPKRQPTLPNIGAMHDDKVLMLSRQTTQTTLPEYSSRPQTAASSADSLSRQPTLPDLELGGTRPMPPTRSITQASGTSFTSYDSDAPLMGNAAAMGYEAPTWVQSPDTIGPRNFSRPPPIRSMTNTSQASRTYSPGPRSRPGTAQGEQTPRGAYQMEPITRTGTGLSSGPPNSFGKRNPGPRPSPTEGSGRRTPATANNPYLPHLPQGFGRNSPSPREAYNPTERPQGMRSVMTGPPPNPRSYNPAGRYAPAHPRTQTPTGRQQPPLHRLDTSGVPSSNNNSNSRYQAYSKNSVHSATPSSARTAPPPPYRSFTAPSVLPSDSRQQASQPAYPPTRTKTVSPPSSSQAAYAPSTRAGTGPPTQRQMAPIPDNVMEDIMNSY